MCGIFGYVGRLNAIEEVYNGLEYLQYRGYDSCGIAYYNKKLTCIKAVGTLKNLKAQISKIKQKPNLAFGHTRWATNGEVNLENTHPHVSMNGEFVVVHNGIIQNSEEIKAELKEKGYTFYSQTDTEVIANLLESLEGDVETRIKELFNVLKGSYALIIGYKKALYLVKNFNPLNLLKRDDGIYISSDASSLKSGLLYSLNDGDIIKVEDEQIEPIVAPCFKLSHYSEEIKSLGLGKFDNYMRKEISEIPSAIYSTYEYLNTQNVRKVFKGIKKITFVACGTAYHSCLIGEWLFRKNFDYYLDDCLASNYTVEDKIKKDHLHIIVSQSGETADCIKVAGQIKQFGGKILIITNQENSTITQFADYSLFTRAGKELAVASTKTYCAQVFTFCYICLALKNKKVSLNISDLTNSLTEHIEKTDMKHLAENLESVDKMILIARDIDYLTMLEASLKIREIDYVYTLPMYSGELKHGTLSLIEEDSVVLSLNTSEDKNKLRTAINEICSRSGKVIEMENFLPENVDEIFMPIYAIIPFQLLSLEIALQKGRNPDMPRNLAKSVTVE